MSLMHPSSIRWMTVGFVQHWWICNWREKTEVCGEKTVPMSLCPPQIPRRSPSHLSFFAVRHSQTVPNLLLFCKVRTSESLDWSSVTKACTNSTQNKSVQWIFGPNFTWYYPFRALLLQSIKYTFKNAPIYVYLLVYMANLDWRHSGQCAGNLSRVRPLTTTGLPMQVKRPYQKTINQCSSASAILTTTQTTFSVRYELLPCI